MSNRQLSVDALGEFPADVPDYFFHMLSQTLRRRDIAFEKAIKPTGLTSSLWRALLMIKRLEPCTMNELSQLTTVERTTLTRVVDQLVAEALVDRRTPAEDRRQVQLSLTDKGAETYDATMALMMPFHREALAGIDAARLRDMTRGLDQILANLVEDPALVAGVRSMRRPAPPSPDPD